MAAVPSNMIPLGSIAPDFTLPDTVSGKIVSLNELKSDKGTLIMFICNHCPYVKHINNELVRIGTEYKAKGIAFIAISSNDVINYPQDGPELMTEHAKVEGYPFPYLYDETQEVAKAYDAACTPDFFLYDGNLKLVYRGQLDNARPKNDLPITGKDLRAALDAVLRNEILQEQIPSIGCNIKWKVSNQ
jgi:thiol-disulfide isomerase/thioredoxin